MGEKCDVYNTTSFTKNEYCKVTILQALKWQTHKWMFFQVFLMEELVNVQVLTKWPYWNQGPLEVHVKWWVTGSMGSLIAL